MSGGVDSSVTAALLKEQGYRVIGMFMKNWEERDANGVCSSAKDYADVAHVCEQLDVPYYSIEFVKEYWDFVFKRFLEEYRSGLTPNPDILCNREIKFQAFFNKARELGADFLATGHYARRVEARGRSALAKGVDPAKDQSYFLYTLREKVLEHVLFPVGDIEKKEVRAIATKLGLATQSKKDSTGICFIGERDFREFLSRYVPPRGGEFRRLSGEVVGRHAGAAYFTIGQRRGLGLGGEGESWYVVAKDVVSNTVTVERGAEHPALYADFLTAIEPSWVAGAPPAQEFRCRSKIRYRQPDQDCLVRLRQDGTLEVVFDRPQRAIAPGQSVVFYQLPEHPGHAEQVAEICLGGAVIRAAGPSHYEQGRKAR
jgi:tRNA-specific 2-thiouridylase